MEMQQYYSNRKRKFRFVHYINWHPLARVCSTGSARERTRVMPRHEYAGAAQPTLHTRASKKGKNNSGFIIGSVIRARFF